ncbi:MAG: hypothetical protein DA408_16340 [Bacteroidetes bacterium]|nr:MAG: hypothetical protein C7N36_01500 [Bacteroidota bacterium]PTM10290.1 MAG: hypothetical protein DA408_16340 [Bacteroidota bacterium]
MHYQLRMVLCLGFLWLATGFLQAETRHIHLIKVFDNENHDYVIREGCRSIGFGIDQEVQLLAVNLGILNVIEYEISGPRFNLKKLDGVLDYEMAYQERDIVIFVYVGHGFRDPGSSSPYPNLYFSSYQESVNFAEIQERIQDKNPSLLINIVVACNVTVTDQSVPPPYQFVNGPPEVASLPKAGRSVRAYQQLFADEPSVCKVVNLFSAEREYYTFLSNDGGIFFNEILYTFQEVLGGEAYRNWGEVCTTIADRTVMRSERLGMKQKPLCEYALRLSPVAVAAPRSRSLFEPSPCELEARDLRQNQRAQLHDLRRLHRDNMRDARRTGDDRNARRLLAQEQRVEYENRKLRHEKEYQRHLQLCQ